MRESVVGRGRTMGGRSIGLRATGQDGVWGGAEQWETLVRRRPVGVEQRWKSKGRTAVCKGGKAVRSRKQCAEERR